MPRPFSTYQCFVTQNSLLEVSVHRAWQGSSNNWGIERAKVQVIIDKEIFPFLVISCRTIFVDRKTAEWYNNIRKKAITRAPRKGGDARHLLRSPCTLVDSCRYTYAFWAGYRHILCKNRAEMEP